MELLRTIAAQGGLGTVPMWLIAGMLLVHFSRHWLATRKLSLEDRIAAREGFASQVEHLTIENRTLRKEYDDYRRLCQTETEQLRDMLRRNEDEISGLKRKVSAQGIEIARLKGFKP